MIVNDTLPDLQFSHKGPKDSTFKTPQGTDIIWWYVLPTDDLNKEGIVISILTKKNVYEILVSTEELVDMLRTVAQEITGSENISLALAEAPDRGLRRKE